MGDAQRRVILLVPAVTCRHCGAPPPIRITEADRARYASDDPDRLVATFRCSACHRITAIRVSAYLAAT